MVKSESVGSGIGAFFNNPGALALGALAVGLLFFQGDIRKAFGSFGESLGNLQFPDINLPDVNFGDFKFPDFDFKFPDFNLDFGGFDFGDPFKGIQESLNTIITQFTNPQDPGREMGTTPDPDVIPDTTGGRADRLRGVINGEMTTISEEDLPPSTLDPNRPLSLAQVQPIQQMIESLGQVQTGIEDQTFFGGGSFLHWGVSK